MDISTITVIQEANEFLDLASELLDKYGNLGPVPGILLPFIEAFLPFLPLFAFVMANSAAYGLLKGFFYSWLGSSLGSIAVFYIIRKFGDKKLLVKIKTNRQVNQVTSWVERHGFGPLFLLLCFPFSPSSLINIVAGLSNVSKQQFILAVLLGKSVMIFSIAYIGTSILEFAKNPIKTIVVTICISIFWMFGKFLEKRFLKKSSYSNTE